MLAPPVKSGPRFDTMIQSDKVRVIDENGENIGVMLTNEAIEQANGLGLSSKLLALSIPRAKGGG